MDVIKYEYEYELDEPIYTEDDAEFTLEEIKQTTDSFSQKKAPGLDGITGEIYKRVLLVFPRILTTIYNQCLKLGQFPKRWKMAKVILILKPNNNNNCPDPNKYRPISLLNMGGKILDKLLINRINHHLYKNELLSERQYVFTPQ